MEKNKQIFLVMTLILLLSVLFLNLQTTSITGRQVSSEGIDVDMLQYGVVQNGPDEVFQSHYDALDSLIRNSFTK